MPLRGSGKGTRLYRPRSAVLITRPSKPWLGCIYGFLHLSYFLKDHILSLILMNSKFDYKNTIKLKTLIFKFTETKVFLYEKKGFEAISFNYHVPMNLEKTSIFQDIFLNSHENVYREIKTIRPECNGEKLKKKKIRNFMEKISKE